MMPMLVKKEEEPTVDNSLKAAQAYQDLNDYFWGKLDSAQEMLCYYFWERLDSAQEMLWGDDKKIPGDYNYDCDPRFDLDCYWS